MHQLPQYRSTMPRLVVYVKVIEKKDPKEEDDEDDEKDLCVGVGIGIGQARDGDVERATD